MAAVEGTSNWTRDGSGFTWDLSAEQKKILDKFEVECESALERVKFPHEPVREAASRFLRARKYDAAAAKGMLEASRAWRDEERLEDLATKPDEEIIGCPVDEMDSYYPCGYLPVLDAEFRPVYIERTGRINVPALLCSTTNDALIEWHKKQLVTATPAKLAKATKERGDGRVVTSSTTIMDLEGFTMSMLMGATKDYLSRITKMDSDNFPETLGATLIINAPTIFTVAWGIVKGFIDPRTQAKITMCGSNYADKLRELMGGKDKVPAEYGGTLVVPGLFRSTVQTKSVHSGKRYSTALRVPAGHGAQFRWISDPADIQFGVVAVTGSEADLEAATADPDGFDKSAATVVYEAKAHPDSKTKTVECSVEGESVAEETVFIATWDNSAGWSQRLVRYFARQIPTKADRAKVYIGEMRRNGVSKAAMVAALRERGFDDQAKELEAEPEEEGSPAAASASSASAASSSADGESSKPAAAEASD